MTQDEKFRLEIHTMIGKLKTALFNARDIDPRRYTSISVHISDVIDRLYRLKTQYTESSSEVDQ